MSACLRAIFTRCVAGLLVIASIPPALAGTKEQKQRLTFVLILTRHGVRAPSATPEYLKRYSVDPWPRWPVAPDDLTPHGYKLLAQFGTWDRNWLTHEGLLSSSGCNASAIYIYTDSDERTIRSGHALAQGLSPSCPVTVHSLPQGTHDPLFHFSLLSPDPVARVEIMAALLKKLPDGLDAFNSAHQRQLDLLQSVLDGCTPGAPCPQTKRRPEVQLVHLPSGIETKNSQRGFSLFGPVFTAAGLAEDLLLEYTQGMPHGQVAWGRIDEAQLRDIVGLHTAEFEFLRTPALARLQISNLFDHILLTLRQAAQEHAVQGAFGPPGEKLAIVDGHDTNIAAIAGLLHLHWMLDGRADDTPPGTQLQFLMYRDRRGRAGIQVRIVMQTLDQMRNARELTESDPPASATLDLPQCNTAGGTCTWSSFEKTAKAAIDRRFVVLSGQ